MFDRYKQSMPLVAGLVIVGCIAFIGWSVSGRPKLELNDLASGSPSLARNRTVDIGGIRRPSSDLTPALARPREQDSVPVKHTLEEGPHGYGSTPRHEPTKNKAVADAFEAVMAGPETKHPERLSPLLAPPPFDAAAYAANPQDYLEAVQPGRAWQAAQPKEGVPVIKRLSNRKAELRQGESVRLQVKTAPSAPVTFTSFDLGAFDNGLASITVAADEQGVASTAFTGTSGTIAKVNLVAASPLASGVVRFQVNVSR